MRWRAAVWLVAIWAPQEARAQAHTAAEEAESLRVAGRPWHAAERLLAAAAREPELNAAFVVEAARAEVVTRRYHRARGLLAGQPWLEDYVEGEALAVLAQAEAGLGLWTEAAAHFEAARARSRPPRTAVMAVRAALAHEAAGDLEAAERAFAAARADDGLTAIGGWLRLRQAGVTKDTAAAFRLLEGLPTPAARHAPLVRTRSLLAAGDSAGALAGFAAAGAALEEARLALALGDSGRARGVLYDLLGRAPASDAAAAGVGVALYQLPPASAPEHAALARAMQPRGDPRDALAHAQRAVRRGDSSGATLFLVGELAAAAGRLREAARAYHAATGDPALGALAPLAVYRRARTLWQLRDPGAVAALSGFAHTYPADTAAPTALYTIGDLLTDRGDRAGAARWFAELITRFPADPRASLARFRLAAQALRAGVPDSAAGLYESEVAAGAPQRFAARFWLGRLAADRGDSAAARERWLGLAREDSLGYYGLRARAAVGLPPLALSAPPLPAPAGAVAAALARIDTLMLAGLDTAAQLEVRVLLARPSDALDPLLALSGALAVRGFGAAAVRLGWQAFSRAPADPRVWRAIYPWPNRRAVEAEAAEFGLDPLLFAALVRQESWFDPDALSAAGARGLAQLMPGTAAATARGLDVTFDPAWLTVPDFNLHLGAAHLAELLRRFDGRVPAAIAAYNAGARPVGQWVDRPGMDDPDQFIELIPYRETREYVRGVLRNIEIYRALYDAGRPPAGPAPAGPDSPGT